MMRRLGDYQLICDEANALFLGDTQIAVSQIKSAMRTDMRNAGFIFKSKEFEKVFKIALQAAINLSVRNMKSGLYEQKADGVWGLKA